MTPTARTVLPTDLVALVSYDGKVYSNEAVTLDRIGTQDSPHPLEAAFEQWFSFATGRHTWISVKGPTLRGLVSARKRGSKLAWEIDCLINADEGDAGVLMSLLDQVTEAAGRSGALKIFLRVPALSRCASEATRCGFAAYRHEQVWRLRRERATPAGAAPCVRRKVKEDTHAVFRLYSATVPETIRRYEAMTMAEWSAAQERIGRGSQYVSAGDGTVSGWLRLGADGDVGRFDLLAEHHVLDDLIETALAKLANRPSVHALVPDFQAALASRLDARGFEPGEEYTVMARRTVRPVKLPARVPARVSTTFG
jgi:hypothetical protein